MIHHPRRNPNEAFTIAEVMIAALVLAMGVMGMIRLVGSCAEMLDLAKKQTLAAQIIQDQIGKVHLVSWSALPASGNYNFTPDASFTTSAQALYNPTTNNASQDNKYFYTITDVSGKTNLKQITYYVTWFTGRVGDGGDVNSGHLRKYVRRGTTYVSKNGLYVTYQRS